MFKKHWGLFFAVCTAQAATSVSSTSYAFDFSAHGYYRNRVEFTNNVDTQNKNSALASNRDNNRFTLIAFNQMRLRTEPLLKLNDNLSLHAQFDFLDNVIYGSAATKELQILSPIVGTLTLPAGPGTIGVVGGAAGENGSVNIRRVWAEILTPIGKFKLGRQPSHWGLGIFQNDGASSQGDFGDSSDRILFLTQFPFEDGGALTGGLLWDIAFEAQFDPAQQGLGGQIRDNGQDLHQYATILLYEAPDYAVGAFSGIRRRGGSNSTAFMTATNPQGFSVGAGRDGDTLLYFFDLFGKYSWEEYSFALEGVYIGGKVSTALAINAIPFSGCGSTASPATGTRCILQLPPDQDAQMIMAALEVSGVYDWGGEWEFKSGFAGGDENPLSTKVTQFGFRPDYDIALLMFDTPLGTSPSLYGPRVQADGTNATTSSKLTGGVPITGNFVNNAFYVSAGYKHHLDVADAIRQANDFSVGGRLVSAWAPQRNVNLNFAEILGIGTLPHIRESASTALKRWYGLELDLFVEGRFFEYLRSSLETGLLIPGRSYNIDVDVIDPGNIVDPVPSDSAEIAFAGRLTVSVEF